MDPKELFSNGYNCCQSVLLPFASQLGLPEDLAFRIGASFGGGMGRRGHVCGTVSGALMVIGLYYSNLDPQDRPTKNFVNAQSQVFLDRFHAAHGSIYCRDLIGLDFAVPGQYQLAHQEKRFDTYCDGYVEKAVQLLQELFAETPHSR